MDWGNVPSWVQVGLVAAAAIVGLLIRIAKLEGRVKTLEDFRSDDLKAIRDVAEGVQKIFIAIAELRTELKFIPARPRTRTRKGLSE